MRARLIAVGLYVGTALCAHDGRPVEPHDLATAWSFDPLVVLALLVSAWLYAVGSRRYTGLRRREVACYWTGWAFAAAAMLSPVHAMGEALFSAHMLQHEILMVLAAPLLILGRPLAPFLWAVPPGARRPLARSLQLFEFRPVHAWWIHLVALWAWHIPALFQATITSDLIHTAQHVSFFVSALMFWWALFRSQRSYGAGAFYVFTTMLHTGLLGVLLTFSTVVWYPAYVFTTQPWGLTALEDQQLGGLIMLVPPIVVYLGAFLALIGLWVRDSDLRYRVTGLVALACLLTGCGPDPKFQAWELVPGGNANKGKALILQHGCGSCHTIPGVAGAQGLVGPPLTRVALRTYLAGRIHNTPENMARWIVDPKEIDDKTAMPNTGVTPENAVHIVRYLYTLR